jgi:hypothetical protein
VDREGVDRDAFSLDRERKKDRKGILIKEKIFSKIGRKLKKRRHRLKERGVEGEMDGEEVAVDTDGVDKEEVDREWVDGGADKEVHTEVLDKEGVDI